MRLGKERCLGVVSSSLSAPSRDQTFPCLLRKSVHACNASPGVFGLDTTGAEKLRDIWQTSSSEFPSPIPTGRPCDVAVPRMHVR